MKKDVSLWNDVIFQSVTFATVPPVGILLSVALAIFSIFSLVENYSFSMEPLKIMWFTLVVGVVPLGLNRTVGVSRTYGRLLVRDNLFGVTLRTRIYRASFDSAPNLVREGGSYRVCVANVCVLDTVSGWKSRRLYQHIFELFN